MKLYVILKICVLWTSQKKTEYLKTFNSQPPWPKRLRQGTDLAILSVLANFICYYNRCLKLKLLEAFVSSCAYTTHGNCGALITYLGKTGLVTESATKATSVTKTPF